MEYDNSLNADYFQERIESNLNPTEKSLVVKALLQNPIAQSGRDLAYFLHKK